MSQQLAKYVANCISMGKIRDAWETMSSIGARYLDHENLADIAHIPVDKIDSTPEGWRCVEDMIRILVKGGANINKPKSTGFNALTLAMFSSHVIMKDDERVLDTRMMDILIRHGADPGALMDFSGSMPPKTAYSFVNSGPMNDRFKFNLTRALLEYLDRQGGVPVQADLQEDYVLSYFNGKLASKVSNSIATDPVPMARRI